MRERARQFLLARLDPSLPGFEARVAVSFAASEYGCRADEAFSAEWADLPVEHRSAIGEVWARFERSRAGLPRPKA